MHQVWVPGKKYPNILRECMWILTWAWDRTRGSRLNNFYKKGKGKKKENIWELITHGRQIQRETANSHATDTTILFKDWAGHRRPVRNMQSTRLLCLRTVPRPSLCTHIYTHGLHVSVFLLPATSSTCHRYTTSGQSHSKYADIFAANLAKPPLEFPSSKPFLGGITETCLEKGGFAHFTEGNFLWWL